MSDYVRLCLSTDRINKKERVRRRVRASISQPTPMPLARQLDRSFRCQFAASGFGANPTWIDGGGRLELRAQVPLSTRRNGVPGNEHDAKSWGARPTEGRSLIQVAAAPPSLPPANGNSLPHARGQRGGTPRASGDSRRGQRHRSFNIPTDDRPPGAIDIHFRRLWRLPSRRRRGRRTVPTTEGISKKLVQK